MFPRLQDIVALNRRHIRESGGLYVEPDNLRNPGSLLWALDAIQHRVFGTDRYPTIAEKASLLAWVIIREHVFKDGSKRTGMSAMLAFLRMNGHRLEATDDEIVTTALQAAGGEGSEDYERTDLARWTSEHLVPAPP